MKNILTSKYQYYKIAILNVLILINNNDKIVL